jgi:GNAT superfamily N-acetyltransferase
MMRRARPDESAILTALAMRSKAHWGYSAAQLDSWRAHLCVAPALIESGAVYVFDRGGVVEGFYALVREGAGWRLEHLWVLPESMRRGIGRTLLRHALAAARQAGARAILIDADPAAEAFYLACGAARTGLVPGPIPGQPERQRPQLSLSVETAL